MRELRKYQQESILATYEFIKKNPSKNPLICLPTGAGKSVVLAKITQDMLRWGKRILIIAPKKELLSQLHETLSDLCPGEPIGINCDGLDRRDTDQKALLATVQSLRPMLSKIGVFDLILFDECHLVNDSESAKKTKEAEEENQTLNMQLIVNLSSLNDRLRIIGLTATPYRLGSGLLYGPGRVFSDISYEAEVRELMDEGFLSKLTSKKSADTDFSKLHKQAGEFKKNEVDELMSSGELITKSCKKIVDHSEGRSHWLVFCCGVPHADLVHAELSKIGVDSDIIHAGTDAKMRADTIERFKTGSLKCLVNVNVLTVGFDAPHVDLIALMRPTLSTGLYVQMVGRGLRICQGKTDCRIMDFGGNIERHGPIDSLNEMDDGKGQKKQKPKPRICPQCDEILKVAAKVCTCCGYEFPLQEVDPKHESDFADGSILSEDFDDVVTYWHVEIHQKKGDPYALKTVRVSYFGGKKMYCDFWCPAHDGFARRSTEKRWSKIKGAGMLATNCEDAREQIEEALRAWKPKGIRLRPDGKFYKVVQLLR